MRRGQLSDLFAGVVAKRLTLVETISEKSNQHEFQGTKPLRRLLGDEDRRAIPTRFLWLSGEQDTRGEDGFMSWSNVRKGKPRAPEYHLYYSTNAVTEMMQVDDLLFLALRRNGSLLAIVVPVGSTIENQLLWLFGIHDEPLFGFIFQEIDAAHDAELDFTARYILDELGIAPEEPEADQLDALIDRFGLSFPPTRIFSELARTSLPDISAQDDPDRALIEWMDREEQMFRRLERRIVAQRSVSPRASMRPTAPMSTASCPSRSACRTAARHVSDRRWRTISRRSSLPTTSAIAAAPRPRIATSRTSSSPAPRNIATPISRPIA